MLRRASLQNTADAEGIAKEAFARGIFPQHLVNERGDGNCLFRALARQVWLDPEYHGVVRRDICDTIQANPDLFNAIKDPGDPMLDKYLLSMRKPMVFGGLTEIVFAMLAYKRMVEVSIVEASANGSSELKLYPVLGAIMVTSASFSESSAGARWQVLCAILSAVVAGSAPVSLFCHGRHYWSVVSELPKSVEHSDGPGWSAYTDAAAASSAELPTPVVTPASVAAAVLSTLQAKLPYVESEVRRIVSRPYAYPNALKRLTNDWFQTANFDIKSVASPSLHGLLRPFLTAEDPLPTSIEERQVAERFDRVSGDWAAAKARFERGMSLMGVAPHVTELLFEKQVFSEFDLPEQALPAGIVFNTA